MTPKISLLLSPHWTDYELLDSGDGQKLERFGPYTFARPEVQALWKEALPAEKWQAAHAFFDPSGEESGGLTIANHVPEKDGVLACLLMAELVSREKHSLGEILKKLYRRIGRTILSDRINVHLESTADGDRLRERLQANRPERLAGRKVVRVDTTDGFKFELDDLSWLAIRLSGTEPVARVYLEAADAAGLKRLGAAGRALLSGQA